MTLEEGPMADDPKQIIIEFLQSKKGKTKHYFNDLCKALPDMKMRDVKKIVNEMINEKKLAYWSSGSTTMYMLSDIGALSKEEAAMDETK
jgi:hypothetical protein